MVDLGFDTRVIGHDSGDALHWAAYLGNADMVRALLTRDPAIGVREAVHGGTPLDWCIYGSATARRSVPAISLASPGCSSTQAKRSSPAWYRPGVMMWIEVLGEYLRRA